MGKSSKPRSLPENKAMAMAQHLRTGAQKLNLVAALIRGRHVQDALNVLTFSKRRIAGDVKKTLMSAIANAENNHGLDVDNLYVSEAYVGKSLSMKRLRARARGRAARIIKPFSKLTIIVEDKSFSEGEAA